MCPLLWGACALTKPYHDRVEKTRRTTKRLIRYSVAVLFSWRVISLTSLRNACCPNCCKSCCHCYYNDLFWRCSNDHRQSQFDENYGSWCGQRFGTFPRLRSMPTSWATKIAATLSYNAVPFIFMVALNNNNTHTHTHTERERESRKLEILGAELVESNVTYLQEAA